MGEKGNLLDTGEEIFANLAEQGPQFWIAYEQYRLARQKGDQATAPAPSAPRAQAYDPSAQTTRRPAAR
jgi:hypothetical protein